MTFMAYVDSECSVNVNPGLLTLGQPKHRSFHKEQVLWSAVGQT